MQPFLVVGREKPVRRTHASLAQPIPHPRNLHDGILRTGGELVVGADRTEVHPASRVARMTPAPPRTRRAPLRRVIAGALALVMFLGLLIAACSSDEADNASTDDTSGDTATTVVNTTSLDDVTVDGALDAKPTITFDPAYVGESDATKVVSAGDGAMVENGQRVTVDYVAVSGSTGEEVDATYGKSPQSFNMGGQDLLPIISEALVGQPIGSRVMVATDATQSSGEWLLLVIDIRSATTIPTAASGTQVTPPPDLPAVTVVEGVPTLATPQGDPRTELVVQPLIEGTGPVVTEGQTVTMQYTGAVWATGKVFDTSWDTGPVDFTVATGQLIAGFHDGVVGQTVGSRVLIVIPPDQGYGAQGNSQAGISGTDTLVFVVDILAAG